MGDSKDREKVPCRKGLWSEKQPVKVQSRSTARIDRRFMQLRAHLRASTQEQCAPNAGARAQEVLFPKSSVLGVFLLELEVTRATRGSPSRHALLQARCGWRGAMPLKCPSKPPVRHTATASR